MLQDRCIRQCRNINQWITPERNKELCLDNFVLNTKDITKDTDLLIKNEGRKASFQEQSSNQVSNPDNLLHKIAARKNT